MIVTAVYIGIGLAVVPWRNLTPGIWPIEVAFHTFLWPITLGYQIVMRVGSVVVERRFREKERRLRDRMEGDVR